MKTATNFLRFFVFILSFFFHVVLFAQNSGNDYFVLYKGGKKFPKIKKYVLLNDENTEDIKNGKIIFYVGTQKFIHKPAEHTIDTCQKSYFNSLKLSSVNQLFIDEKNEFNRAKEKEKLDNFVPPIGHYILKIFLIKQLELEQYLFFEVEWENSIP